MVLQLRTFESPCTVQTSLKRNKIFVELHLRLEINGFPKSH